MFSVQTEPSQAPNCWQCRYFAISWDVARPYSCKLMGFKSKAIPSLEVLRADGQFCQGFALKDQVSPQRVDMRLRMAMPVKPSRQIWEA
jgi:hypothetical protein